MDKEKELINIIDKMTQRISEPVNKDTVLKYLLTLSDEEFDAFVYRIRKKRKARRTLHKDTKTYDHKADSTDDTDGPKYDIKLGV